MPGPGFKKGKPKTGGRTTGTQNRVTVDTKKLMMAIVEYGLSNGKRWLERTAQKNPARALEALAKLAEYTMPKLAKTDIDLHGGVQVLERRFYGEAPEVEVLNSTKTPALPEAVDAEVVPAFRSEDLI
jgi:hypothetical protein